MKDSTFIAAMRNFFGFKEGQHLIGFKAELDQLTDQDRQDFKVMFKDVGINITN